MYGSTCLISSDVALKCRQNKGADDVDAISAPTTLATMYWLHDTTDVHVFLENHIERTFGHHVTINDQHKHSQIMI